MILFKKRITKALISLRGCAGWSAPLLFANPEDRFSCDEAHIAHIAYVFILHLSSFKHVIVIHIYLHSVLNNFIVTAATLHNLY